MPLFLPSSLPTFAELVREGCDVRPANEAGTNAFRILFVNQMAKESKTATDIQWGRLLAGSPYHVVITPTVPDNYASKDGLPVIHYQPFSAIKNNGFDGLIVTGAPLEDKPLEDIKTWPSLNEIYKWSKEKVSGSLFVCWAAQMALHHFHDIEKQLTKNKMFGVYAQELLQRPRSEFGMSLALNLAGASLNLPVSRYCYADRFDVHRKALGIDIILDSGEAHPGLLYEEKGNRLYSFNHPEYDQRTLEKEYVRDYLAGRNPELPRNYLIPGIDRNTKWYPEGSAQSWLSSIPDPVAPPWRPAGQVIVNNWLRGLAEARNTYDI